MLHWNFQSRSDVTTYVHHVSHSDWSDAEMEMMVDFIIGHADFHWASVDEDLVSDLYDQGMAANVMYIDEDAEQDAE